MGNRGIGLEKETFWHSVFKVKVMGSETGVGMVLIRWNSIYKLGEYKFSVLVVQGWMWAWVVEQWRYQFHFDNPPQTMGVSGAEAHPRHPSHTQGSPLASVPYPFLMACSIRLCFLTPPHSLVFMSPWTIQHRWCWVASLFLLIISFHPFGSGVCQSAHCCDGHDVWYLEFLFDPMKLTSPSPIYSGSNFRFTGFKAEHFLWWGFAISLMFLVRSYYSSFLG